MTNLRACWIISFKVYSRTNVWRQIWQSCHFKGLRISQSRLKINNYTYNSFNAISMYFKYDASFNTKMKCLSLFFRLGMEHHQRLRLWTLGDDEHWERTREYPRRQQFLTKTYSKSKEINCSKNVHILSYIFLVPYSSKSVKRARLGNVRKNLDSTHFPFKRYPASSHQKLTSFSCEIFTVFELY